MGGKGRNNSKVVFHVQESGSSFSAVTQKSSMCFMGIGQFASVGWKNFVRGLL